MASDAAPVETPRATQEIDVVIAPNLGSLERLLKQFPEDVMRKAREFSQTEFERRIQTDALGVKFFVASAEDVLIAKLSQSERQIRDAAGIIRTQASDLDVGYIARWVEKLGLAAQWAAAQSTAEFSTNRGA